MALSPLTIFQLTLDNLGENLLLSILHQHQSVLKAESWDNYKAIQFIPRNKQNTGIFSNSLLVLKAVNKMHLLCPCYYGLHLEKTDTRLHIASFIALKLQQRQVTHPNYFNINIQRINMIYLQ